MEIQPLKWALIIQNILFLLRKAALAKCKSKPRNELDFRKFKLILFLDFAFFSYKSNDIMLKDPEKAIGGSWEILKEVYLDNQNVTLDLGRMRRVLLSLKSKLESDPKYLGELKKKQDTGECS